MKKTKLLYIVIATHVLFIFLHIYKQTQIVSANYQVEKLKNKYCSLKKEKLVLQEEWYTIQNPNYLRNHAYKHLAMKKIRLSQIKKMPYANNNT